MCFIHETLLAVSEKRTRGTDPEFSVRTTPDGQHDESFHALAKLPWRLKRDAMRLH
jgi:hypothetical protein